MGKVTLQSLTLVNFKGEKQRTTHFNADVTTISGANGTGKSRHFDAFVWLLFGKDAQDRKDYEVKTRIDGKELHNAECSVEAVLYVDGVEITLKRALVEDWVKPRGQAEQVYKGNHTDCWWNGAPVRVSEYDKRVAEIVPPDVFKMVTNPAFFASMKWQLQREQLFLLAGTVSDTEIAAGNADFKALLDKISGKPLADFRAELSARKKRLKTELGEVQPRIDQTRKLMPEAEDFAALEKEIADVKAEITKIDEALAEGQNSAKQVGEQRGRIQEQINALEAECEKIFFEAEEEAARTTREKNRRRRVIIEDIENTEQEIDACEKAIVNAEVEIARLHQTIAKEQNIQAELRQQWYEENAKPYTGSTDCPHCGQPLPESMIEKARALFNTAKEQRCAEIISEGRHHAERVKVCKEEEQTLNAKIDELTPKKAELANKLAALKGRLASTPEAKNFVLVAEEIPGYTERQEKIKELEEAKEAISAPNAMFRFKEPRETVVQKLHVLEQRLMRRDDIYRCEKEIAFLEQSGRVLAQQLADAEKEEYTMQEFTRAKVTECEKRVNTMFKYVTFRLYDYTLDGNPVETCIPLIEGVPYGAANTASRVNAGLDIINALCRYYGVSAPVFCDNSESINTFIKTDSQMIYLRVTENPALTVE